LKACEEIGTVLNMKMSQAVDRDGQLFREKLDDILPELVEAVSSRWGAELIIEDRNVEKHRRLVT
jgi:hypothetical protein